MEAVLALRQARAELSTLLEAIWPGLEHQDGAADAAGAGVPPVPTALPATLDDLEAHYRSARAAWEQARRRKGAAVGEFLRARADRTS